MTSSISSGQLGLKPVQALTLSGIALNCIRLRCGLQCCIILIFFFFFCNVSNSCANALYLLACSANMLWHFAQGLHDTPLTTITDITIHFQHFTVITFLIEYRECGSLHWKHILKSADLTTVSFFFHMMRRNHKMVSEWKEEAEEEGKKAPTKYKLGLKSLSLIWDRLSSSLQVCHFCFTPRRHSTFTEDYNHRPKLQLLLITVIILGQN